jgi:hypothetical protein
MSRLHKRGTGGAPEWTLSYRLPAAPWYAGARLALEDCDCELTLYGLDMPAALAIARGRPASWECSMAGGARTWVTLRITLKQDEIRDIARGVSPLNVLLPATGDYRVVVVPDPLLGG